MVSERNNKPEGQEGLIKGSFIVASILLFVLFTYPKIKERADDLSVANASPPKAQATTSRQTETSNLQKAGFSESEIRPDYVRVGPGEAVTYERPRGWQIYRFSSDDGLLYHFKINNEDRFLQHDPNSPNWTKLGKVVNTITFYNPSNQPREFYIKLLPL